MRYNIFSGKNKPFQARGKTQWRLLEFAFTYPTWHSYNEKSRADKRAIESLVKKGSIVLNEFNQFKINL